MNRTSTALIIDDEPDIRELLEITLNRMQVQCKSVENLSTARSCLQEQTFDICLTDMKLPDGNGVDFVDYVQVHYPTMPIAVITAHGSMDTAISALKKGAFDFLTKPVDLNLLRNIVTSALNLSSELQETPERFIGQSDAVTGIQNMIGKLARSQAPVYISGESGTGKELVARMIHSKGPRSEQPFVPVNCGAIPEDLMESEFFGYVKGSFTGADRNKDGLFTAADGGTLFLDEVADLPAHIQVKLLRAIQENSIRPIGANSELPVNVRILCATHKDLNKLVQAGEFRQDLYYRLNVIELNIPPLRERRDDIPLLVRHFLERQNVIMGMAEPVSIAADALDALVCYAFPGNIRELENVLQRAATLCEGNRITTADLQLPDNNGLTGQDAIAADTGELPLDNYLEDVEKKIILGALEKHKWNKTATAKSLGISLRALRYRLEKLGLE